MYRVTELMAGMDGARGERGFAGGAVQRKMLSARAYGPNVF